MRWSVLTRRADDGCDGGRDDGDGDVSKRIIRAMIRRTMVMEEDERYKDEWRLEIGGRRVRAK